MVLTASELAWADLGPVGLGLVGLGYCHQLTPLQRNTAESQGSSGELHPAI